MTTALAAPSTDGQRALSTTPTLGFLENAVATFEGIDRLAKLMASMGTMPDHLQGKPADCFRIVVQSAKWGMDPFAVAECTSLVHGRLCYEGKLVAAVLRVMNAIDGRLAYEISGKGQDASIVVTGKPRGGEPSSISGSVADWRTHTKDKNGNPIKNAWDKDPQSMLVYRGTRQWARLYAPEAIFGVYTPDELDDVREVQGTVTETIPEPKPGKDRDAPTTSAPAAATAPAAPATTEQPASGVAAPAAPAAPTMKDVNELAIKLHSEFKGKATDALKAVCAKLGIEKISGCPADRVAECHRLLCDAHTALRAGGAA